MAGRKRRELRMALPATPAVRRTGACVGLKLRRPAPDSAAALGALMLDAYQGTVDYEGEDLAASVAAMVSYFAGKYGRALAEHSVVAWRGTLPISLSLVAWWDARRCPFVAFVATRADSKGAGVGRLVLAESVRRTSRGGHPEIRAVVTEGNEPSFKLFASVGFEDLGPLGPLPAGGVSN